MKRGFALALTATLCACAPMPVQMPAARASEVLNLFATGRGPANVCSDDGRAVLRGAVKAYSREMNQSGVAWPVVPGLTSDAENLTHVDVSVMIAYAAGFVRTSDFQQPARRFLSQLTFGELPEIVSLRRAALVACEDVQALQQATARFVMEQSRMADLAHAAQVRNQDAETANRLRRQSVRVGRARNDMQTLAALVHQRMDEDPAPPRG
jgi:hypothetical protein